MTDYQPPVGSVPVQPDPERPHPPQPQAAAPEPHAEPQRRGRHQDADDT